MHKLARKQPLELIEQILLREIAENLLQLSCWDFFTT